MKAQFNILKETFTVDSLSVRVTNRVRNIDNGLRRLGVKTEVVTTVNKDRSPGKPYMPRQFPKGEWLITAVEVNKDSPLLSYPGFTAATFDKAVYGSVRIRTDAHQSVDIWALDQNGGYKVKTGAVTEDYGYLFHYSPSQTTLGCGRFFSQNDAIDCAKIIASHIAKQGPMALEVL